ncbi:hypothetical protein U1Q18_047056, partial [Sarracenia purpurea var. burkii]
MGNDPFAYGPNYSASSPILGTTRPQNQIHGRENQLAETKLAINFGIKCIDEATTRIRPGRICLCGLRTVRP